MKVKLQAIKAKASKIKPWVALSGAFAFGLLLYFAFLGMQYMDTTGEIESLTAKSRVLSNKLRASTPNVEDLEAQLEAKEEELSEVQKLYEFSHPDDVLATIEGIAEDAEVELGNIAKNEPEIKTVDGVRYRSLIMNLNLNGPFENVFSFLSLLQQGVPGVSLANLGLSGYEESTDARIDLQVLLAPELVSSKQGGTQ